MSDLTAAPEILAKEDLENLRRAREVLDLPDYWAKGSYGFFGISVCETPSYCLIGAVIEASGSYDANGLFDLGDGETPAVARARARLNRAIGVIVPNITGDDVERWNDSADRDHAEVLAALDRAIRQAEADAGETS